MLLRWITGSISEHKYWREHKNRDFKYESLKQFKDKSLSGMFTILMDQFFLETYNKYNPKAFLYALNLLKTYLCHSIRFSFPGS